MTDYQSGDLVIKLTEVEDVLNMHWHGKSIDREPANTLIPYFTELTKGLSDDQTVTIDFCALEFMNSSTVRPILTLLQLLEHQGNRTTVLYDNDQTFQRTSFKAIGTLTRTRKHIKVYSKDEYLLQSTPASGAS